MRYKIMTAVAVSFVLGIATANAANSPQQIVNAQTMVSPKNTPAKPFAPLNKI